MEKLIEKLNSTGIKFLDLVDKGLDKLPDGINALWEAAVIRVQFTGILSLVGSCIGLIVIFLFCYFVKKHWEWIVRKDLEPFVSILGSLLMFGVCAVSVINLLNTNNWLMAIAPEQYILSELMLNFIK